MIDAAAQAGSSPGVGELDLVALFGHLAVVRPLFSSEADLQLALARRLAALAVLLEAAGEQAAAGQVIAAAVLQSKGLVDQLIARLLAPLHAPTRAALVWLAETGEGEQVAEVAALLDQART